MIRHSLSLAAMLLLAALAGCDRAAPPVASSPAADVQSPDWANPGGTAVQGRISTTPEEALYVEKCSMCHREMGMGTVILARRQPPEKAVLERRDDLTVEFIRVVVRSGLGNMPRITRGEVSDEQLNVISRHLVRVSQ